MSLKSAVAFARLCVETKKILLVRLPCNAVAFARLCVETKKAGSSFG